jgi:hypothetical protein
MQHVQRTSCFTVTTQPFPIDKEAAWLGDDALETSGTAIVIEGFMDLKTVLRLIPSQSNLDYNSFSSSASWSSSWPHFFDAK